MSHSHDLPPRPELGCYMLREVHQGKADGVLMAHTQAEEAAIYAAGNILGSPGLCLPPGAHGGPGFVPSPTPGLSG